jgi:BirA family biotin operon repressor/biotin-[acetyl-CoA-carboxylase] ligase
VPDIFLWGSGKEGFVAPLDPDALGSSHEFWGKEIVSFGPWVRTVEESIFQDERNVFWRRAPQKDTEKIMICGKCASSMDVAWEMIGQNFFKDWDSVIAVEQVAGRGQHRREWVSPPGNIYASWAWSGLAEKIGEDSPWRSLLSLVTGYIVARALEEFGLFVKLKWPNDLILKDRKIGGILIEERRGKIVFGIGLNTASAPPDGGFENDYSVPATSFDSAGIHLPPLSVWVKLVKSAQNSFERIIADLKPIDFIELVTGRLAWLGRQVLVKRNESDVYKARIAGLAPDGGLVLKRNGTDEVLYSGRMLPV